MKLYPLLPIALIALAGLSLGSGCPTFPKLEDRVMDLAVGGTTTLEFRGRSTVNTHWDTTGVYNLATQVDLNAVLDDAGIDVQDVTDIKLSGVSYRVSVADTGSRTISAGTVTVQRLTPPTDPPPATLVTSFSQNVGSTTSFITAPLTPAGVTVLNTMLSDILTAAKNHTAVVNPSVRYEVSGDADGVPYDFKWQLKLDVSIVGKIKKIKVLT